MVRTYTPTVNNASNYPKTKRFESNLFQSQQRISDFIVCDVNTGVELLLVLTSHTRKVLSAEVETNTPVFFGFQLALKLKNK